ncbi:Cupredoxin [Coprinopsis sp. MPI-PUGE-AT-0042]|nr:Cupredoxin [Coprinopsis sp. MPI-PUGE-AT-0042]
MISTALFLLGAAVPLSFAATYDVQVGPGGRFVYEPAYIQAQAGDTVNFVFNPKNHTVTQSAFDPPCVGIAGGFRTGFVPVTAGSTEMETFTLPGDYDGSPLWFYCGQGNHCGQGMVFAINAPASPSERSFEAFQALAIARNGTSSGTSSQAPPAENTSATPPPQPWQTATATVTWGGSVYTTTYSSYEGSSDPTPAPQPVEHKIIVGANNGLVYEPSSIQAKVGDRVVFEFQSKNHTVTQSSFSNPCQGLVKEDGSSGFKSGFRPVQGAAADTLTFAVTINDTAPIWGYCGQTGHCAAGMVFAINAVESGPNNFAAFQALAKEQAAPSGSPSGSAGAPTESDDPGAALSVRSQSTLVGFGTFDPKQLQAKRRISGDVGITLWTQWSLSLIEFRTTDLCLSPIGAASA